MSSGRPKFVVSRPALDPSSGIRPLVRQPRPPEQVKSITLRRLAQAIARDHDFEEPDDEDMRFAERLWDFLR